MSTVFSGCQILGGPSGIHFTYVRDGRPSGEAYIEMNTQADVAEALKKDQQNLGKRYIEGKKGGIKLFLSTCRVCTCVLHGCL